MKKVLFLCTHNSARSQMAEAILNLDFGGRYSGFSAGTVKTEVKPEARVVMEEIGADMSDHYSKTLQDVSSNAFDLVITVCDHAQKSCPIYPARTQVLHRAFQDPSDVTASDALRLAAFRSSRDELRAWISEYFSTLDE